MKTQTTYRIEPGDTIYLVTRDREIKSITLTEDHLSLVGKFEHDYTNQPCYYSERGRLYQDVIKRSVSYFHTPIVEKTNIWLLTDEVSGQETEIPLYAICEENNTLKSIKIKSTRFPIFAYTTRELAQEQIRDLVKLDVANDIAKYIDFIVINNFENLPLKAYTYRDIDDWDDYIKAMADYDELLPIYIKLRDGRTFTKVGFEAYVNKKFEEKLKDTNI